MNPRLMLALGFVGGLVVAAAALTLWSTREQARAEAETATLQLNVARAEHEARQDREALRKAREELRAIHDREIELAAIAVPVKSQTPAEGAKANDAIPLPPSALVNAAILNYLGEPVMPPDNLDPKYTAEGLTATFKGLCEARGIEIEKFGVDTSEFPFVVYGMLKNGSEFFRQIDAELKTVPGYAYSGSVTTRPNDGSISFSLSMIPNSEYPRDQADIIHRRKMIRLQMLQAAWEP